LGGNTGVWPVPQGRTAEVAGRRGSPPRADSGSALARNWRSRDAARVP
jgi:hypothetical protein